MRRAAQATLQRGLTLAPQWRSSLRVWPVRCVLVPGRCAPKDRRSCALYLTEWQRNCWRRAGSHAVRFKSAWCRAVPGWVAGTDQPLKASGRPTAQTGNGLAGWIGGNGPAAMDRWLMCANHARGNKRRRGVRVCLSADAKRGRPSYIPSAFVGLGTRSSAGDR